MKVKISMVRSLAAAVSTLGITFAAIGQPVASTGALGELDPTTTLTFDTDNGTYQIDGGSWLSGGTLDSGGSAMLYDFTGITLGQTVTVSAFGGYSLGLVAEDNIVISDSLSFAGANGQNGQDGYGQIAGGSGGGGGGGGALMLYSSTGSITVNGNIDLRVARPERKARVICPVQTVVAPEGRAGPPGSVAEPGELAGVV